MSRGFSMCLHKFYGVSGVTLEASARRGDQAAIHFKITADQQIISGRVTLRQPSVTSASLAAVEPE
jgi:hypothetical protein